MAHATNTSIGFLNGTLYSYPELVFCAVGFSMLIVLVIVGNSLVLVAVARTKKLQNITNVFVVNLSVCDCLTGLASVWSVPGMVSTTPGYPLGSDVPCVAAAGLLYISVACGMYTLANIALNRCILITRPKKTYQWLYTPKKIALMVLGSWIVPFCAIVVPPLSGVGDLGFDVASRICNDVDSHPRANVYDKIQFALSYPVPLIVIIVSYSLIWRHVKLHFKNRRDNAINLQSRLEPPTSVVSPKPDTSDISTGSLQKPDDSSPRHSRSSHQLGRIRTEQLTITKNLFVVMLAFIFCFTPHLIVVLTRSYRYRLYSELILFVSFCINPFIYAAKHPHFRPVLRSMIRCRCSSDSEA